MAYNVGDRIDLIADFKVTGVATDPTTIAVTWGRSGFTASATWVYGTNTEIARVSAGTFSAAIYPNSGMTGTWFYKFSGTTACHAAISGYFQVVNDWLV